MERPVSSTAIGIRHSGTFILIIFKFLRGCAKKCLCHKQCFLSGTCSKTYFEDIAAVEVTMPDWNKPKRKRSRNMK